MVQGPGAGCRVQHLGLLAWGVGSRAEGLGFRLYG